MVSRDTVLRRFAYDSNTGHFTSMTRTRFVPAGSVVKPYALGYVRLCFGSETYLAHRVAWFLIHGRWPKFCIDHIDGNKANNAISNLRDVPQLINSHNVSSARSSSRTGLLGAHFSKRQGKFVSQIMRLGVLKHIGTFDTAEEAHEAYMRKKMEVHHEAMHRPATS